MFTLQRFKRFRILFFFVITAMLIYPFSAWAASRPEGLGNSYEEIVKLAQKEGEVRMTSSLRPVEQKIAFADFHKKYPGIKIEYTRISGVDAAEKIFTETLAGLVEYDVVKVTTELQQRFLKAGIIEGPFDWIKFFPKTPTPKEHISPEGYFVGPSLSPRLIVYNPNLVPPERVPRSWADCLDPYWKGRFVADPRPHSLISLYPAWGEEKLLDYAKKLGENKPIWQRSLTSSIAQLSAGEYPMIVGMSYSVVLRIRRQDPRANVKMAWPEVVPVRLNEAIGIIKGAKNPNAAFLLMGYLISKEGQLAYDKIGRGSPFVEGTKIREEIQKAGSKAVFAGWDEGVYNPPFSKKIVAIWGFPSAGKKKKKK